MYRVIKRQMTIHDILNYKAVREEFNNLQKAINFAHTGHYDDARIIRKRDDKIIYRIIKKDINSNL